MKTQNQLISFPKQNWSLTNVKVNVIHRSVFLALFCFCLSFSQAATYSGTYSVGSTGHFKTISLAVDSLKTYGVSGPVVLLLQAQTFNEQIEISAISGSSAKNSIIFKGQGDSTELSFSTTTGNRPIININGAKHIVLDSLMIKSSGNYGIGVNLMNSADSNTIQHCNIILGNNTSAYAASGIANFSAKSGTGTAYIQHLTVRNNTITGGFTGLTLKNTGTSPNFLIIENNIVKDFGQAGMQLSGCIQMDVIGNEITSSVSTATSAITMWPTAHSIEILGNTLDLSSNVNHTRVLQIANAPGGGGSTWSEEILVANNFVSYHGTYTSNVSGLYTKHVNYLKVHHNTIVMDSISGAKCLWFDALQNTGNVESKNNNLVNNMANGPCLFVHGRVTLTLDHNNLYNSTGFNVRYHNTTYTSLASYQTGASQGANSVAIDPDFISSTNYHINTRNASFDNLGEHISSVTMDYDGDTRNKTIADIGADEFKSGADIAITGFGRPMNCRNTSPVVPIEIWVKNLASTEVSNISLNYTVNGGAPITEIYKGPLKAKDSVLFAFNRGAVMKTAGKYTVVAYTGFLADEVLNNDTAVLQMAIKDIKVNLPDSIGGCAGSDINVNPGSFTNVTFLWSDNSKGPALAFNSNNIGSSTHWVQISDANGCVAADTFKIVVSEEITEQLGPDTTLCPSTELSLSINQKGASYTWQDGSTSNQFNVDSAGTYSVYISTGFQCNKTDTITVDYFKELNLNLGGDQSICNGDSLILTTAGKFVEYVWHDNSKDSNFTVKVEGVYWVNVTDKNECSASDSVYITVKDSPKIDLGSDTSICQGDTLHLDVIVDGHTYLWQDNTTSSTHSATTQGLYTVKATNGNNCEKSGSLYLTIILLPEIPFGNDTTICEGNALVIDATKSGATYKWQDGSDQSVYVAKTAGKYSLEITDSLGCMNSGDFILKINPKPIVELGRDTFLYVDSLKSKAYRLSAGTGFKSYLWSIGSTADYIEIDESFAIGNYDVWVRVEGANGCVASDTIRVRIGKVNSVFENSLMPIVVYPNPNNGKFTIDLSQTHGLSVVEIYNQNGQLFTTKEVQSTSEQMDLSTYAKGIYFIRLVNGSTVRYGTILVQ